MFHRDLKCANLLVTEAHKGGDAARDAPGEVRICDFSESRVVSQAHKPMTACGTAFWIAPEVFRGVAYTEKCDAYSYGVVLLEMCYNCSLQRFFAPGETVSQDSVAIGMRVVNGWRPHIARHLREELPDHVELIESCWDDRHELRPSFRAILGSLEKMSRGEM